MILFSASSGPAGAGTPTDLDIMVQARGSKFIGSSMGGMRVVIEDVQTGKVLDKGVTEGGTGDTEQIMQTPHSGLDAVVYEDAASYATRLELTEPTLVRVSAHGPLDTTVSAHSVSAEQWLIPGRHLTGKAAWILEWPGLVVDLVQPTEPVRLEKGDSLTIEASVLMGCGCILTPGGLWDVEDFEVKALLSADGETVGEVPLSYAGEPSSFAAEFSADQPGEYRVTVYAFQHSTGNTGLDRMKEK